MTSGNVTSGNATSGNATSGNATSGKATSGNATSGNATSGNATSGNATSGNATSGNERTVGHLFHRQASRRGDQICHHKLVDERWQAVTWRDSARISLEIGMGLWAQGVRRGDTVAILSQTSAPWSYADLGILGIGAITVGIYPTSKIDEVAYILEHAECKAIFVEDEAQLARVLPLRNRLPHLETIISFDPDLARADIMTLDELETAGAQQIHSDPEQPKIALARVEPGDVATLVYTSGTTGRPKGVVLTHESLYEISGRGAALFALDDTDVAVVALPYAHVLQRVASYAGLHAGLTAWFSPSLERMGETWQIAGPTAVSGVPRIYEKIQSKLLSALEEAPPKRRRLFDKALAVGHAVRRRERNGERVPFGLRLRHRF